MIKLNSIIASIDASVEEADQQLTGKRVKVVRNGQVTVKEFRVRKKRKMSSKMKQALQKAQKKAHTGTADKNRAKSMKIRKRLTQG
ncbi:hypothetical protein [Yersinia ruckeri]|uniref:hypothetical protein n=1 Tax=Yersinia ruckeri TaxID=29486 RepID=UPI002238F2EF|nr:hypothetical protein [Yersinia ruckeri]MCW6598767.1 hypothetical protein [Yersinia ruckeri]